MVYSPSHERNFGFFVRKFASFHCKFLLQFLTFEFCGNTSMSVYTNTSVYLFVCSLYVALIWTKFDIIAEDFPAEALDT